MAIVTLTSNENGANSLADINANFVDLDTTKADLASPTFSGTPSLPTGTVAVTQAAGDSSTKIATTAFVDSFVTPSVHIYQTGGTTITTSFTVMAFAAERFDTDTFHDTVTNNSRITIPTGKAGKYMITGNMFTATNIQGVVHIRLNGATYIATAAVTAIGVSAAGGSASVVFDLAVADYVEFGGYLSAGTAGTSGDQKTNFSIFRI